ncbi:hypothetical protein [Burkholderia sp. LMU1-1-1.1]|jgi:hypothetical protein|uniref:hypothetical protein n=1 Tax=Burkholderia sp. LMU1-1-1.1 TaxID=3135266 RepID=UPI00342399BB
MKSVYPRAGLALLCAVVLSACGGGSDGSMLLQGSISGLTKPGLVLINRPTGEKITIAANASSFQFTRLIAVDESFDIQIDTPPTGATCKLTDNTNKANSFTSYRTVVSCTTNPWVLSGKVQGLADDGVAGTNDGVTLANGPDTVYIAPPPTAGAEVTFSFANTVGEGSPYGVTVLAQPSNRTCSLTAPVTNSVPGAGVMPSGNDNRLVVNCVAK